MKRNLIDGGILMDIIVDLFLYIILMGVIFHEYLTKRSLLAFVSLGLTIVLLGQTGILFFETFIYYFYLLSFTIVIYRKAPQVTLLANMYFVAMVLTKIIFFDTMFYAKDYFTIDLMLFHIVKFSLFAIMFVPVYRTFYKEEALLSFMNKGNRYVVVVLFIIILLEDLMFQVEYFNNSIYYAIVFSLYFILYFANYGITLLFYREYRHKNLVVEEIEGIYNDLDQEALGEEHLVISKIRKFVLLDDFKGLRVFMDDYKSKMIQSRNSEMLKGLYDQYVKMMIEERMISYPEVYVDILVDDFHHYEISRIDDHFIEIFKIILDNAFEASSNSDEKHVVLSFKDNTIKVSNSYNKEDLERFYTKTSSKGYKNRLNGLKLLESLQETSDIFVFSYVDSMVRFEMQVMDDE